MQRIVQSSTGAIILALLVGALLGIGGLYAAQQAGSSSTSWSAAPGPEPTVTQMQAPASSLTAPPTPGGIDPVTPTNVAQPTSEPMATPVAPVTPEQRPPELGQPVVGATAAAEVSSVEVKSAVGGVEVTLQLRNRQSADLSFPFDPAQALSLVDAHGRTYHLAWAEHDGQPTIPAGGEARLVRAFFTGPVDELPAEGLRLDVQGIPGMDDAKFDLRLPQPSAEPLAEGETARGDSLALTLESAEADPETGGFDVVISVANVGQEALRFDFSPHHDLTLTDSNGNSYNVQWAEYDGRVTLNPGQRARLVRAHFQGPFDRLDGEDLQVQVRHLPRIGGATWSVQPQ